MGGRTEKADVRFPARPKFTRQLRIGPYIAYFACRQARLVVELDGSHHADCARDVRRDVFLASEGWTVLRVWNAELDASPEGVFDAILQRAAECLGGTHPQPFPSREGRMRVSLPSREGRKRRLRW